MSDSNTKLHEDAPPVKFPVEAAAVHVDRLRPGSSVVYLRLGASYRGASEFAAEFLDLGRVYTVVEVNHCGTAHQVALSGITIPACEDAEKPCYCWFDHALFAEAES